MPEQFYRADVYTLSRVAEGDSLVIYDNYEFVVESITSTDPLGRDFGDSDTYILLRRLPEVSQQTRSDLRAQEEAASAAESE